jgi:phage gp36-like protein
MGKYIDPDDILIPDGLKTYLDNDTSEVNLAAAIKEAENTVDSFVCLKFEMPLTPQLIQGIVKDLSKRLTLYFLYPYRQQSVPVALQTLYDNTIIMLKDISTGAQGIGVSDEKTSPSLGAKSVEFGRS